MRALARELAWGVVAVLVAAASAWFYFGGAWSAPCMRFVAPYAVEFVDPWLTTTRVACDLVLARYVVLGVRGWLRACRAVPPRDLPWLFAWCGCVVTLLALIAMSVLPLETVQPWARGLFPVVDLLQPRPVFGGQPLELPEQFFWMVMSVQWPACGALIDAARRVVRQQPIGEHREATT